MQILLCGYATLLSRAQKKLCNLAAGGQAIAAEMLACLASRQDKSACTQLRAATAVLFLATKPAGFKLQSGTQTCVDIHDSDKKVPMDFLFALSRVRLLRDEIISRISQTLQAFHKSLVCVLQCHTDCPVCEYEQNSVRSD